MNELYLVSKYYFKKLLENDYLKIETNLKDCSLNNLVDLCKIGNVINLDLLSELLINLSNYKSLNKNKFRDFDLKKQDCYQIIRGYRALAENNIECMDSHQGNILLNTFYLYTFILQRNAVKLYKILCLITYMLKKSQN